ncbi:hypothetical protein [Mesorhizobium sp. YR577]|uniref:hypothetical protein n=1 Tax=Mesorhizobium sp. YR577 TaxID=1884373 RepID=UPI0008EA13FD|nr:hypothetical protein [Mesorhizobium sp. YR577]SFT39068.1 hypothetical protein SAMN05518861_10130 [Mesorhizobium sp. YR577]
MAAGMWAWLRTNFLKLGVVALVVDVISRFYAQIGMQWISDAASGLNLTFAYLVTLFDIAASLLWGLFSLGFASKVLTVLNRDNEKP